MVSYRDDPPATPLCPECCSSDNAERATEEEMRWGHRWYCGGRCQTYYVGTVEEFTAYQRRKAERAADHDTLNESHRAGQNQGVLGGDL